MTTYRSTLGASLMPGDIVVLKSGSARMTVEAANADAARVIWSDWDTKEVYRDTIPLIALMRAPEKDR